MAQRILICGLPKAGKTTFARNLVGQLTRANIPVLWLNGDIIREEYNDWDFSLDGRLRQANRMRTLADNTYKHVILDFVCPLQQYRDIVSPTYTVFLSTDKTVYYENTSSLFEPPKDYNMIVTNKDDIIPLSQLLFSTLFNHENNT